MEKHYQVSSTASVEALWQKINDLAGLASWHPLITATNAPNGQVMEDILTILECIATGELKGQIL